MPIVITPNPPSTSLTPTQGIQLASDFVGPLPTGSQFVVTVSADSEGARPASREFIPTTLPFVTYQYLSRRATNAGLNVLVAGQNAFIVAQLVDNRGVALDSGTRQVTWDPTSGLPMQIAYNRSQDQSDTHGALTQEQSTQLLETWESSAQVISVDSTIPSTSGPGLPGQVISAQLPLPVFGLIVRVTSLPPDIVLGTPDQDYAFPSLAVATIFRGSDIWMRVPVHTTSKMIPLFSDLITAAVATITAATWLADMSYQVAFREGVAGEVIEMRFP